MDDGLDLGLNCLCLAVGLFTTSGIWDLIYIDLLLMDKMLNDEWGQEQLFLLINPLKALFGYYLECNLGDRFYFPHKMRLSISFLTLL